MDEEVSRDNAPRADHSDSSSPPSLVFDSNITDVVESTISVPANNDLTMVDSESTATAQHVTITSSAALDVAGNNLDKLPNELRQIIFKSSLYNAVRVNKAWFDSLIDHLWYKPGWGALLRPVEGRRQFYADKIRIFELDGNEPAGCQNRQYTGAKSFQLCDCQTSRSLYTTVLVIPLTNSFSSSVLEALQNCPRLRQLVFQDSVVVFDLDPFIDFITNHSYMSSIKFGERIYTTDPLVDHSNKIYAHLLRLSRFSSLNLGNEIGQADVQQIMDMVGRPLVPNNNLTSLSIYGHPLAVNLFLSTATRALRSLNITLLEEYSGNVCDQLSQFTNLAELRLRMCPSQTLPQSEFDALTHLSKLEVLKIFSRYSGEVSASADWLTNEHFNQWVMNFPHLHDLTLVWDNEHLTESAMLAVASHCRKLERCTLGWKQDLDAWKSCTSGTVLFPHLKHLGLRDLEDLPNMNEEHWVAQALPYLELLFELAPRLERLELLKKDDDYCKTTRAIQTAIKEIGGNGCDEDSSLYWKFSKEMVEKYKDEKDKDEKHRDENHKDDEHS
ncbi:hypothetical protein JADG_007632 [Aureobasidium aubasidani]|nr:hypothetical protein JADG_007632 [Aureobasidium pullulans]